MEQYILTDKGKSWFSNRSKEWHRGVRGHYDIRIADILEEFGPTTFEEVVNLSWHPYDEPSESTVRGTLRSMYEAGLVDRLER